MQVSLTSSVHVGKWNFVVSRHSVKQFAESLLITTNARFRRATT